jgi:hypothetical protein
VKRRRFAVGAIVDFRLSGPILKNVLGNFGIQIPPVKGRLFLRGIIFIVKQ